LRARPHRKTHRAGCRGELTRATIKMGKAIEEVIARLRPRRRLFALGPLVLVTTTCLQNPGTDPFGNTVKDPAVERVWTIILRDDSGKVWIAQSDTSVTAGGTSDSNVVSAQLWSA